MAALVETSTRLTSLLKELLWRDLTAVERQHHVSPKLRKLEFDTLVPCLSSAEADPDTSFVRYRLQQRHVRSVARRRFPDFQRRGEVGGLFGLSSTIAQSLSSPSPTECTDTRAGLWRAGGSNAVAELDDQVTVDRDL
jgi:hypothetical protein